MKLLICLSHGWHMRKMLHCGVMEELRNSSVDVSVISPNAEEPYFKEKMAGKFTAFKSNEIYRKAFAKTDFLRRNVSFYAAKTVSDEVRMARLKKDSKWRYNLVCLVETLCKKYSILKKLFLLLDYLIFFDKNYVDLIKRHNFDAILVLSTIHQEPQMLIRAAQKLKKRVIVIIESWDHPSSKTICLLKHPDLFLVWNDENKKELIKYHNISEEKIKVTGSAYHDIYAGKKTFKGRKSVLNKFGLCESKKTVFLGGSTDSYYPDFEWFLEEFMEKLQSQEVGDIQFVVRPHPQVISGYSEGPSFEKLNRLQSKYPQLYFHVPETVSQTLPVSVDKSDVTNLAELIYHSDVVISFLSTLTIDACLSETPVILVGFDDPNSCFSKRSINSKEVIRFLHQQKLLAESNLPVPPDMDSLVSLCVDYFVKPNLHANRRRKAVKFECGDVDGNAFRRTASEIVAFLSKTA